MQRFTQVHELNAIKVKSCLGRIFPIVRDHGDIIYNQLDILKRIIDFEYSATMQLLHP